MEKLTVEQLIAKKIDNKKVENIDFHSDELGGSITIKRLPLNKILCLMSGADKMDLEQAFDLNIQLIYESCPILKSKELQDAFEVAEPTDIVIQLFNENINEINNLASTILSQYGLGEVKDTVKK